MSEAKCLIMLNQMAGPLFCELAIGLSDKFLDGVVLHTGHPDAKNISSANPNICLMSAPIYNRKSKLTRVLSWLMYLFSTTRLILFAKKGDVFLLSSNPPILGIWFWLLNIFKKSPYVLLVYDVHPDVLVEVGVVKSNNLLVKAWHWLNQWVYRDAKSVVTLGRHMAARLAKSNALDLEEIVIIPPWVDTHSIKPVPYQKNPLAKKFNPDGRHVILYSGNMGISHDIDTMLEAAKLLKDRDDILFLFIGGGDKYQTVVKYQKDNQLNNIAVYPYQPETDLPYTMTLATISLVALGGGAQALMIPSKVFYYMAAGSAVVGIFSGENELKDIIDSSECGVYIKPGDAAGLADKIKQLLLDVGKLELYRQSSRESVINMYDRKICIERFSVLFSEKL